MYGLIKENYAVSNKILLNLSICKMDPKRQKLKRITRAVVSKHNQDMDEESKIEHKRHDEEEKEFVTTKQTKGDIGLTKHQNEFIKYNEHEDPDEDAYRFEDQFDDEWGNSLESLYF